MVYRIKNTTFASNTYVITDDISNSCIIIDPGIDAQLTDECIAAFSLNPIAIIATHGHFDHIANVSFFKEKYKIPFYLHEFDQKVVKSANFFIKIARINFTIKTPVADFIFKEKENHIRIGNFNLDVKLHPGHSAGSCIIKHGANLFSGDTFYKKGLGFNSFPDENKTVLRASIKEIFSTYSDENMVYPGHGNSEKLGIIKKNNEELIQFLKYENLKNE